MPLYEFVCPHCGKELEAIQKYNDPYPICEECQKEMVKKISVSTSFILNGGGWAKDGYK